MTSINPETGHVNGCMCGCRVRVYIVSNGKMYSDHRLYFIETDDKDALILACRRADVRTVCDGHKIVGHCGDLEAETTFINVMKLAAWEDGRPIEDWERTCYDIPEDLK